MKKGLEVHIVGPQGSGKTLLRQFIETALNHGIQRRDGRGASESENGLGETYREFRHKSLKAWERTGGLIFVEHTPPPASFLTVYANPMETKGSRPWIRFAPGNGWSIYDTKIKGCHCINLEDAVKDYNRGIDRKFAALNLKSFKKNSVRVHELPGWGDAVRDEMQSRRTFGELISAKEISPINFHGSGCSILPEAPEMPRPQIAPADGIKKTAIPASPDCPFPGFDGLFGALMGGFLSSMGKPVMDEPNAAIVAMLESVGWLERVGPVGMVKIPRRLSGDYAENLVSAIENNDVVKVAHLLAAVPAP